VELQLESTPKIERILDRNQVNATFLSHCFTLLLAQAFTFFLSFLFCLPATKGARFAL
jgi:hypothetical protein